MSDPDAPGTMQYATGINWALNQKYNMKKNLIYFQMQVYHLKSQYI
ncbi:hypothetical protein XSR1_640006 [Xenorhabdus szentirmaii DSM 16338]|uniref:Uncharacterized protein n=1 Tax=Xenorhabdus szentirmaii DSM 16338 TaxID=1427518 RepID=W1J5P5_9GAMM|nr:hypothetical protein XSR1_640006 [Xenorhabdus szentirmaii DSM 16338]